MRGKSAGDQVTDCWLVLATLAEVKLGKLGANWLSDTCDCGSETATFCTRLRGGMSEPGHGLALLLLLSGSLCYYYRY